MEILKKYWHFITVSIVVVIALFLVFNGKDDKKDDKYTATTYISKSESSSLHGDNSQSQSVNEVLGYVPEQYIELGQYIGIEYKANSVDVTDDQLTEAINEELKNYRKVDRISKEGDAVNISYTAFVDDKKEDNLCMDDYDLVIGEQDLDVSFDEKSVGKKAGDTFSVNVVNPYYFPMEDEKAYDAKEVRFEVTINYVMEEYFDELTDSWVKDNYSENGLSTVQEYKDMMTQQIKEENEEDELLEKKTAIWEKVIDNCKMNGYPEILYNNIVEMDKHDMKYEAEEIWGMSLQQYIEENDIDVEQVYMDDVKAELVMWCIANKENLNVTQKDIEQGYENLYEDYGCSSVEEMKEQYSSYEIERALVEEKVVNFVCDNAIVK